jgi:hypothetical protein
MSKLDNIEPTGTGGKYKVELNVEGEWVSLALLSREAIEKLADYMCSDELGDMPSNNRGQSPEQETAG